MNCRKILSLILAITMLLAFAACGPSQEPAPAKTTLNIFATDNCMVMLSTASEKYKSYGPNVEMKVTIDDGVKLALMIEAGYKCDVFIADSEDLLDWLDKTVDTNGNPNKNDCIDHDSRVAILTGPADEEYAEEGQTEATYTAAVTSHSYAPDEAKKFIEFLQSDAMDESYANNGFSHIK